MSVVARSSSPLPCLVVSESGGVLGELLPFPPDLP